MDIQSKELYDAIENLKKYRFPLSSDKLSTEQFLNAIFAQYNWQLQKSNFLQREDKEAIQTICLGIVNSIKDYNDFDMIASYSTFFSAMNAVKDQLWWCYLEETPLKETYSRIRKGTEKSNYSALEMLHIPFECRHFADNARFSLPGIPSTYMASNESVAWYESGMPPKFYLAKFTVKSKELQKHKVLKLDINPLIDSHDLQLRLLNAEKIENVLPLYISMAKMYPILFACSIIVKNKSYPFKQEYIIPQMLMSWVKQSTEFVGIRYNTASGYETAPKYCAFNLVMPTKEIDADGYCSFLKNIFLENATTKFIDVKDYLNQFIECINSMRDMREKAKCAHRTCEVGLPYRDLLEIIQSILQNYDLLCNQYDACAAIAIDTLATLKTYNNLHIENLQTKYGNNFSDFTVDEKSQHLLSEEIKNDVKQTLLDYRKLTTKFFDGFTNFADSIFIS